MEPLTTQAEEQRYAELQSRALDLARAGETEKLADMLRHGLPVNLADASGNSLLMLACYHQNAATARMLLEQGADVDRRNHRQQTPLGGVAFKGYEDIVALLLAHGAKVDADNGAGMTPLRFAALFGRSRVVEQLEAHDAAMQRQKRRSIVTKLLIGVGRLMAHLRHEARSAKPSPKNKMSPPI